MLQTWTSGWVRIGLVLLLVLPSGLNAQTLAESTAAMEAAWASGDYPAALEAGESALSACVRSDSLAKWLETQRQLAYLESGPLDQPFRALDRLQRALIHLPRQPRDRGEYAVLCKTYLSLSWIAKGVQDFLQVKSALEQALALFDRQLGAADAGIAGYLYLQLGNAYVRLGEYAGARLMFENGIRFSRKHNAPGVAKFNDFGSMYLSMGQDSLALDVFEQGIRFAGLDVYERTLLQLNRSECLLRLGDPAKARRVNDLAAGMISRQLPPDHENYWRCMYGLEENYALIAQAEQDQRKALAHYRAAIEFALQDEAEREAAGFQAALAEVYLSQGEADRALAACRDALQLLLPGVTLAIGDYPPPGQLRAEKLLIRVVGLQLEAFRQQGNPERALQGYERIAVLEALLRRAHDFESSSLMALAESRRRFDRALGLAWALYERGREPRFAERAFYLSEQARGLLLLESLAKTQAAYRLPDSLRQKENALNVRIAWLEGRIALLRDSTGQERQAALEQELFRLLRERDRFRATLRQQEPGYARLLDTLNILHARDVAVLMRPAQAMASYYLTETELYVFFFGPEGRLSWRRQVLPDAFRADIGRLATILTHAEASREAREWFQRQAHALYRLLLEPELAQAPSVHSLVIVPDDVLSYIPFEILLRRPVSGAWADLPYLLRDYELSYAYSATLLDQQQRITRQRQDQDRGVFAGFAPSYSAARAQEGDQQVATLMRNGIYELQGTHAELRAVHALVGGAAYDGDQATEARFKHEAALYRMLLLSMHGLANEENPALSRLLFGDQPDPSGEDNSLYAYELQAMRFRADLAVLSACHTGFGKLQRGEGVYSLARAFAAAGVPATVMSLWRLPDGAAPVLMTGFFRCLKDGMSKDASLRKAKLDFLADPDNHAFAHPGYWSGVVANGDMSVLHFSGMDGFGWLAGMLAALAALFLFRYLPRRSVRSKGGR